MIGLETGVEPQTVSRSVIAHSVKTVEADVRVVAAKLVLTTRDAVDEQLKLVVVGFQVARNEQVVEPTAHVAVGAVQFRTVCRSHLAEIAVSELRPVGLEHRGRSVFSIFGSVDSKLREGRTRHAKQRHSCNRKFLHAQSSSSPCRLHAGRASIFSSQEYVFSKTGSGSVET